MQRGMGTVHSFAKDAWGNKAWVTLVRTRNGVHFDARALQKKYTGYSAKNSTKVNLRVDRALLLDRLRNND